MNGFTLTSLSDMKSKYLLLGLIAACAAVFSCQRPDRDLSMPSIEINQRTASVDMPSSSFKTMILTNRAWKATADVPWIAIDPDSGDGNAFGQTVTITVQKNTGYDRVGNVVFDIVYDSVTLPVSQAGIGNPDDFVIFYNDFDLETATQAYGSGGSSWPFLDQFGGWKNEKGVGIADIQYAFAGMSCRNNSSSNGNYSDYDGSGVNNLLFGTANYLAVKNLDLKGNTTFRLSFGSEKYDNNNQNSTFNPSEFFVYASDNGERWVPVSYTFNGTAAGRWNVAEGVFSVPEGTEKLSLYLSTSVSSVYRVDDLKLEVVQTSGTLLDFSYGIDLDTGGGGGDTPATDYENAPAKTVREFIDAAATSTYYKLTGKVSRFNPSYCSFDLTDDTGTIYVYSVDNKDEWSSKITDGGTVTLAGKYLYYASRDQHEVVNAYILSFYGEGGGGGGETPTVPFSKLDPSNFKEGKYVIAYPSGGSFAIMKNAVQASYYVAATAFDLSAGNAPTEEHIFTVAKSGSGYTIKNNEGGYVGVEVSGTHYNLKPGLSSPYVWTFTKQSDGSIEARGSNSGDYVMSYDAGHNDFTLFNKTPSYPTFYHVDGATPGGDTPGGDTPSGEVKTVTVAQFIAAPESNSQVYELVGTIGGSINTTYGNFDLTDDSGTVYVYGMTATNLGYGADNDKSYASLGLNSGDKIKLRGYRGSFNGKIELMYGWFIEKVNGGGGDTPGGDTPGEAGTITWVVNADNQSWAAASDGTYGAGFSATADGMTVAYYKGSSTSNPVAPNASHVRIYKNSHLSIKVAGKTITAVELNCEPNSGTTSYCFDLSVTGGGTATADKSALKIRWSGSAASFEADAVNGQVRINQIKVTYK